MYNAEGLLEFCRRTHHSLDLMIQHCKSLSRDEFNSNLEGFGIPTVKLQLHHAIGAQKYWIGVLEGRMDVDDDPGNQFTIEQMEQYRLSVMQIAENYLKSASPEDLITARPMMTWRQIEKTLVPVHIVIRTLTHIHHHLGQVAAMCRLIGKPIPTGMDYPILP